MTIDLVTDAAVREVYLELATNLWPQGCALCCPKCGRMQAANVEEIAGFLAAGWPFCHGHVMHVNQLPSN